MTKKELVKAAEELNNVLGLDPQINVKQKVNDLKEAVKQAAELIEPEDEFTPETFDILNELCPDIMNDGDSEEDQEEDEEEAGQVNDSDDSKEDEDSSADEEDDEDENEDDDEDDGNEPEAEDSEGEEEPVEKPKKDKDKDKPKAKEKKKTENKLTKKAIVEKCIEKGATIEQIAEEIVKVGLDDDFEKNCRVVKAWLGKMGFDTKKAAVEANPIFKLKK